MPIIKLYHSGLTAGIAPMKNDHDRETRGDVQGWSASASRRNLAFLRSIRPNTLTGQGFSLTLTIKNCPDTAEHWHRLRRKFIKRLERKNLIRLHWVTEWQRRGVPHLHGAAFFEDGAISSSEIIDIWCDCAAEYVCKPIAQHVGALPDVIGWFKYLAKHAARGHLHYQRTSDNIPEGWKKTGRVWGYVGDWVKDEPMRLEVSNSAYFAFRRIVRSWCVANARKPVQATVDGKKVGFYFVDWHRVNTMKSMLKCNKHEVSALRGVSEWIDEELALKIFSFLAAEGHEITS